METCQQRMERIDAKKRIADFMVKEQLPYEFKVKYARVRVQEFVRECEKRDLNYHVSVGGLDSITLFLFLKSIGIHAPGISVAAYMDIDTRSSTLTDYSIDISSISGSYYVKFYANVASQQGWLKIAKIWLT